MSSLTIDVVLHILAITIGNPVLMSLVPLTLLTSTALTASSSQFRWSLGYAVLLWTLSGLRRLDRAVRQGSPLSAFRPTDRSPRPVDWHDQVVVITGGSSGLGSAIATLVAQSHPSAHVFNLDVNAPGEQHLLPNLTHLPCDVSDLASVQAAHARIHSERGRASIVISNAGIMTPGGFLDGSLVEFDRVVAINLRAQFILAQTFLPDLIDFAKTLSRTSGKDRRPGVGAQYVTVASTLGLVGVDSLAAYCASKAGTISLHESLTAEVARRSRKGSGGDLGVVTTLVLPGQLDTDMFRAVVNPSTFLAPTVGAWDLAKSVLKRLERREAGEFGAPFYANHLGLLRVLPSGLVTVIRSLAGLDRAAVAMARQNARGANGT